MDANRAILLQLNSIDELFVAPAVNPFSAHEVDILGRSGIDIVEQRLLRDWPRRPRVDRLTLQLPADRVTPELVRNTPGALRHYCSEKIASNRLQRRLTIRRSLRQLVGAFAAIGVALAFIAALMAAPLGLLPGFLRGVLVVLALYACSVLSFDALWSLVFDWVPYVQDNTGYRLIMDMEVAVEPAGP